MTTQDDLMHLQQHAEQISRHFAASIEAKQKTLALMQDQIILAADKMYQALMQGNKVLSCGNGGSAGDAMHFSSELVNRFEQERKGLAAIALTADTLSITSIANDYAYKRIFARQVEALGQSGDILLAISTSGNSENVIEAIKTAQQQDMMIIAFTGKNGGEIRNHLTENDIELCVASDSTARTQEVHLLFIHCLCDLIDQQLIHG
jgi:phosphoheptose isomerase